MSEKPITTNESPDPLRGLGKERVTRFLQLGLGDEGPMDTLQTCLKAAGGGAAGMAALLEGGSFPAPGELENLLARDGASLKEVLSFYGLGKERMAADAAALEDRMAGLIVFLLAVAAGVVHHRVWITSRKREEIDPMLLELSAALPEPWRGLLARAVESADVPVRRGS